MSALVLVLVFVLGLCFGAAIALAVCRESRRPAAATVLIDEPGSGMVLFRMTTDEIDRIVSYAGPTSDTTLVPIRLRLMDTEPET